MHSPDLKFREVTSAIIKGKNVNKPFTVRFWIGGKQKERSFSARKKASDFKINTDHDTRAQIFVDDKLTLGGQKFSGAATTWLENMPGSERSKEIYGFLLRIWILPPGQTRQDLDYFLQFLDRS
jgi:hypothetical protein